MKQLIFSSFICLFCLTSFAQETITESRDHEDEQIFTSKDKDYLQYWHYEQVLKMDLSEDERDGYLSHLNYYVFKMSRLGLAKYGYTETERKEKFDALVVRLNEDMKDFLSPDDYEIHEESFDTIVQIVYEKRDWSE